MHITQILAIIIFGISLIAFNNRDFFNKYLYSPYVVWRQKEWYRILTSGFLHANWIHLLINLFVFWEFGSFLESAYIDVFGKAGSMVFVGSLFIGGVVIANVPALFKHRRNMYFRSIGASGGVSAVLFSYILINPWSMLYLYFVIPLYSIVVGVLFLIYSFWASKNSRDNIDHLAHFWGSIFGIVFTAVVYPEAILIFWEKLMGVLPF
jgi:membrane associated rhomboid family serine protease